MSHFELEAWLLYVEGDLSEPDLAEMEQHLYACDVCMDRFMACVERQSSSLPEPSAALTAQLLQLPQQETAPPPVTNPVSVPAPAASKRPTRSERSRTMRNYFIAAAATIVLMVTGAFNTLFKQVDTWQQQTIARDTSVSAKLVDQTASYFENLHRNK